MPPKGWRKNGEAVNPPHVRQEPTLIDEILFPKGTVQKLAKLAMPEDAMLAKDSLTAIQRSATVFVLHLLFQAREILKLQDRKNVSEDDILRGLEKAGLLQFVPDIEFRTAAWDEKRRQKKAGAPSAVLAPQATTETTEVNTEANGTKKIKTELGAVARETASTDDEDDVDANDDEDDDMEVDEEVKEEDNEVVEIDDDEEEEEEEEEEVKVKPSDVEVVADLGSAEVIDSDTSDDE